MYRHYLDEVTMTDTVTTTSLLSNPIVAGAVAACITAAGGIAIAVINKKRKPEEVKGDLQKLLNDTFKVVIDGYDKQISAYRQEHEQQNIANERLHTQLEKVMRHIAEQEDIISSYGQKIEEQNALIRQLTDRLSYFDTCRPENCLKTLTGGQG